MRSKEEVCGLVAGFAKSGLPRREYRAKHGVAIATWRRAHREQKCATINRPALGPTLNPLLANHIRF